jgi:hypothetical protein
MNKVTHIRDGRFITKLAIEADEEKEIEAEPEVRTDHKSINRAKRESRAIQARGGVLRCNR